MMTPNATIPPVRRPRLSHLYYYPPYIILSINGKSNDIHNHHNDPDSLGCWCPKWTYTHCTFCIKKPSIFRILGTADRSPRIQNILWPGTVLTSYQHLRISSSLGIAWNGVPNVRNNAYESLTNQGAFRAYLSRWGGLTCMFDSFSTNSLWQ